MEISPIFARSQGISRNPFLFFVVSKVPFTLFVNDSHAHSSRRALRSSPHHPTRTTPVASMLPSALTAAATLALFSGVARAAHPRSPEHCYCETWSVGNAHGALGGLDGHADFAPGRTYSGGRKVSSAGNTCVPWSEVRAFPTLNPLLRPLLGPRRPINPSPNPRTLVFGSLTTPPRCSPTRRWATAVPSSTRTAPPPPTGVFPRTFRRSRTRATPRRAPCSRTTPSSAGRPALPRRLRRPLAERPLVFRRRRRRRHRIPLLLHHTPHRRWRRRVSRPSPRDVRDHRVRPPGVVVRRVSPHRRQRARPPRKRRLRTKRTPRTEHGHHVPRPPRVRPRRRPTGMVLLFRRGGRDGRRRRGRRGDEVRGVRGHDDGRRRRRRRVSRGASRRTPRARVKRAPARSNFALAVPARRREPPRARTSARWRLSPPARRTVSTRGIDAVRPGRREPPSTRTSSSPRAWNPSHRRRDSRTTT